MANLERQPLELSEKELRSYLNDGFLVRKHQFGANEVLALKQAAIDASRSADNFAKQGKTYFLDGKRFVDRDNCTMQYEYGEEKNGATRRRTYTRVQFTY